MTIRDITLLILLILFSSCNSSSNSNNQHIKTDSLSKSLIDTITYSTSNTRYTDWNDTLEIDSPSYYLDTFTIAGNKFRIVYKRPEDYDIDATLEKFMNGQWAENIWFNKFNGSGVIKHSIDVNNDGYNDITRDAKWFKQVYFFDKEKNDFIDTVCTDINDGILLLDTAKKIYCDFQEFRQLCGQIHSKLYTFKNFKRINLFDVELYNCTNDYASIVTKLIVSKCFERKVNNPIFDLDSLIEIETKKLAKPINLDRDYEPYYSYFDYIGFWKKNYKRLMGYSQH